MKSPSLLHRGDVIRTFLVTITLLSLMVLPLCTHLFFFFFTEMGRTSSTMLIEMVTLLVLFSISKAVVGQDDLLSAFQRPNLDFPHDHILSG